MACENIIITIEETNEIVEIIVNDFTVSNILSNDLGNSAVLGTDGKVFVPTQSGGVENHSELNLDDGTNPHGTTKSDVGLGNVNNTSDADKPVSNATQTALNTKLSNDPTTYTNATLPLSGTEVAILNNGTNWVKITWNNIKAQLSLLYAPKDETIITNLSVSGTYNIDYSAGDVWRLTLTGNTTLTESNLPASGKTKTINLQVNGNFSLTYPAVWTGFITGSYIGTSPLNTITVQTLGTDRKVQIVQPT